jgi:hypothetical protein
MKWIVSALADIHCKWSVRAVVVNSATMVPEVVVAAAVAVVNTVSR